MDKKPEEKGGYTEIIVGNGGAWFINPALDWFLCRGLIHQAHLLKYNQWFIVNGGAWFKIE